MNNAVHTKKVACLSKLTRWLQGMGKSISSELFNRILLILAITCSISACTTVNPTTQTGKAVAFSRGKCAALSQWVEPLKWRYPNSQPGRWMESTARERMKFLFTDPYFVPVFGSKVDELSNRQLNIIHNSLKATRRNACKNETYLLSIYPGIFLARVFNPQLQNTAFSMSYVVSHAKAARNELNHSVDNAVVKLVQKRISEEGFNVGPIDGQVGPSTAKGIIEYKQSKNMQPVNGDLSPALIARLDAYYVPKPKPVIPTPTPKPATSSTRGNTAFTARGNKEVERNPQESLDESMSKITTGEPITLTASNRPYFAGFAGAVLKNCTSMGTIAERTKLANMVFAAQISTPLTDYFSNDNIGQALRNGANQSTLFNTGYVSGRQIGCGQAATQAISALSESL